MFLLHGEGNLTVVSKDPGTPLQFSSQGDKFKWRITRVDPKNIYQYVVSFSTFVTIRII